MEITKKTASGVLRELLAKVDEKELARTRKRMLLAVKIEEAMKKRGYNQKQFSQLMGKSQTVVSEWLSGNRNFTIDTLTDIEEVLQIHLVNVTPMTVVEGNPEGILKTKGKARTVRLRTESAWGVGSGEKCIEYVHSFAI